MGNIARCISIKEPYASMIMAREKTLEWRSRKLLARAPESVAIATSKSGSGDYLPRGHIVGVARISAVVPFRNERSFYERAGAPEEYNRYGVGWGGYAYMLGGFAACEPVPIRGNVGIYKAPEGFAPVYASEPSQLVEWWTRAGAKAWAREPESDEERDLMDAMLAHGIGWRIDD